MATFYSPDGNPEVWEIQPEGYFTEDEWFEANPPEVAEIFEAETPQAYVPLETRVSALEDVILAIIMGG